MRGFLPQVVSLAPPGPVAQLLADEGVTVHSCHGKGGWDFRVIRRLARIIESVRPDLVHALLFHANVAARRAARRAGLSAERVLCEIQTVEVERRWHLWVDRWTHRGCRVTIGNSPSVIEHLAKRARIPQERLRLVPGGIDPERIRQAAPIERAKLGLADDQAVLLWAGRLDPVKGLDHLIEAVGRVAAKRDVHLLLAGDGPQRAALATLADRRQLAARVHFLGARDDIPALLQMADVFVFPSRTEGLPNALLEAMAACRAIVTTDVPGCRDLIRHDETGLVVPFGDPAALAGALMRLLEDPDLAAKLGCAAGEEVERHWHIDQTYAAYESLYRETLS